MFFIMPVSLPASKIYYRRERQKTEAVQAGVFDKIEEASARPIESSGAIIGLLRSLLLVR
jgi:hypothetical protein